MNKEELQAELDKTIALNIQLNSEIVEALKKTHSHDNKEQEIRELKDEVIAQRGVIKFLKKWHSEITGY